MGLEPPVAAHHLEPDIVRRMSCSLPTARLSEVTTAAAAMHTGPLLGTR